MKKAQKMGQVKRFKQTAREIDASMRERDFDELLRNISQRRKKPAKRMKK